MTPPLSEGIAPSKGTNQTMIHIKNKTFVFENTFDVTSYPP